MKILTVVHNLRKGGTERAALVFAQNYREQGLDSRILVGDLSGVRTKEALDKGLRVYTLSDPQDREAVSKWGPDVVHLHSHGLASHEVRLVTEIVGLEHCRFVETNVFSSPSSWEHLLEASFQLSEWGMRQYDRRGGDASKAIRSSYPVAPMEESRLSKSDAKQALGIDPNFWVIGRVGQDAPAKWSNLYMSVIKWIGRQSAVHFLVVNPPSFLQKKLERLPSQSYTIVDSITNDEKLADAYRAMDIFLHIADQGESFGYVLAEAGLFGIPTVTLSTPWGDNAQSEIIINGLNGFVVNKPKNLVGALHEARGTVWDAQNMRSHILNSYGASGVSRRVLDIVEGKETSRDCHHKPSKLNAFDSPYAFARFGQTKFGTVIQMLALGNFVQILRRRLRRVKRSSESQHHAG